jgi:hypothetical protein
VKWEEMAERVKEAASKGLHVTWSEGSDCQIVGTFLEVHVRLRKNDPKWSGQYLGMCSLKHRDELLRIVQDHNPSGWRNILKRHNGEDDGSLMGAIALVLRRCCHLEADSAQMPPEFVVAELAHVRHDLEVLYERALSRKL